MNNTMKKIVATGYELELLNSMIERVGQLYELPARAKEALDDASNAIQEQAVALDMIDSLQTSCGPLRRSFSEQDLVILHSLVVNSIELMQKDGTEDHPACASMIEARKMLEHPDNE